ncbi:MAG: hypothetical protein ABSH47_23525 [Bryobacteraceae bacterium]|jgi:hypothetical protein
MKAQRPRAATPYRPGTHQLRRRGRGPFCASSLKTRRRPVAFAVLGCLWALPACASEPKISDEDRVEILRGLTAEYAKAKVVLPRSKHELPVETNGQWDKEKWAELAKGQLGPAARVGDLVQVTKVSFDNDKIVLEINGGQKQGKWYKHIEIGMGGNTTPLSKSDANAPGGTYIALLFHKPLPPLQTTDIKKMLAPVLDFEKTSVTQNFVDTLPPEQQKAIKENRVIVGMERDAVLLAMGRPRLKSRETDSDGLETEDWVYGDAPGKITFITFANSEVIRVKEAYADLGGSTAPNLPAR